MIQSNRTKTIGQLEEFVKQAAKLGKYPLNTATGMLSVIKIVAGGLTDDEPGDIPYITEHISEIFHRQINSLNISQGSLLTYIARVRRIINDFQTHGQDTKAFHAWKPKKVQRAFKNRSTPSDRPEDLSTNFSGLPLPQLASSPKNINLRIVRWSLRSDLLIEIQLPVDLNKNDVARLKKLLDLEAELTPNKIEE